LYSVELSVDGDITTSRAGDLWSDIDSIPVTSFRWCEQVRVTSSHQHLMFTFTFMFCTIFYNIYLYGYRATILADKSIIIAGNVFWID